MGVGYLYQQRHLAPYNGLPVGSSGNLLSLPNHTFVGADWNKFKMNSHDVFADLKHYFDDGGYGKIGMRYSDRDADSNYTFAAKKLSADNKADVVGLGTEIKQKAFAVDASYSRPFALGNTANELVVGADYNRLRSTNEQGRAAVARNVALGDFHSVPYVNLMQNARAGARGYSHTVATETLTNSAFTANPSSIRSTGCRSLAAGVWDTTKSKRATATSCTKPAKPSSPATQAQFTT